MENSQPIHIAKTKQNKKQNRERESTCSEENTKGEVEQLFDEEISMNSRYKFKQPPQQKLRIEMDFTSRNCQFGPTGIKQSNRPIVLQTCFIL